MQGASTPDQARRNSSIPKLPEEILAQCSEATETLRKAAETKRLSWQNADLMV